VTLGGKKGFSYQLVRKGQNVGWEPGWGWGVGNGTYVETQCKGTKLSGDRKVLGDCWNMRLWFGIRTVSAGQGPGILTKEETTWGRAKTGCERAGARLTQKSSCLYAEKDIDAKKRGGETEKTKRKKGGPFFQGEAR